MELCDPIQVVTLQYLFARSGPILAFLVVIFLSLANVLLNFGFRASSSITFLDNGFRRVRFHEVFESFRGIRMVDCVVL